MKRKSHACDCPAGPNLLHIEGAACNCGFVKHGEKLRPRERKPPLCLGCGSPDLKFWYAGLWCEHCIEEVERLILASKAPQLADYIEEL